MAIEQSVLQELKTQLEANKLTLEQELGRIANPTGTPGEYETRFEDFGREEGDSETETEQYVDNIAVENTLEQKLQDIIEALERMEAGTYGKCEVCGADIALDRLQAYPSAKICMNHN
ncbi:MAG: TraR/DksA C4-type zinc finger protein [Candidatus Moranbacteria bacterium]|nr:TraR/DksA C4-type zinc finger protein [Candidatus Moranbacteria bacterium]